MEVCHHLECIFREHGTPTIIQTDQGTEFKGMFDELCSKRNIRRIRSRAYHPESQGKVINYDNNQFTMLLTHKFRLNV